MVCTTTKLQCPPPEYDRKLSYGSYRKFSENNLYRRLIIYALICLWCFDDIDDNVCCFVSSLFHDMFKLDVVSSKFKKIDNLIKNFYRPVSILIVWSKVYERVMANQLLDYSKNTFYPLLSAFRNNYGCQSTLNMVQHVKIILIMANKLGA